MKITKAWLEKHDACEPGKEWFVKKFPKGAPLEAVIANLDRFDWFAWIGQHVFTPKQSALLACIAARQALKFVPAGEERPRLCIETVEMYVKGEKTLEDLQAAIAASDAASAAASAASAAASAASDAASAAASAASDAARAAAWAARAAASAAAMRDFFADVSLEIVKASFLALGKEVAK